MDEIIAIIQGWFPLIVGACLFIIPYGMLANETYRAVFKTDKVPMGLMILHYVPFYNYICIRKYLYGKALPTIILSCIAGVGAIFRAVAIFVWGTTDPIMMIYSVYAAIGALVFWYITMAFTSCYTSILTRRSIFTIIIGTLIAPLGAFLVSKNIRKYFKQTLEVGSEFRVGDGA